MALIFEQLQTDGMALGGAFAIRLAVVLITILLVLGTIHPSLSAKP